jgi:hypothetical protein
VKRCGMKLRMIIAGLFALLLEAAALGGEPPAQRVELPTGPAQARQFGAFYTRLRYDPAWEEPWRVGEHPDVLVTFDGLPVRFVFWRGTSMIPCWVTENGIWYTNEFVERFGGGAKGCAEPMSDKQCRFSHVRIIESTPARTVIHWRYSPVDVFYQQPWGDKKTNWGDWVDEYYTVYPDGVGVRKIELRSSALKERTEFFESIVINPPRTFPEANIRPDAVTLANLSGETVTWLWTKEASPEKPRALAGACVHRMNLKSQYSPFAVFPEGVSFEPYRGHEPGRLFHFWNHWPVSQELSWTTAAETADNPSHSSFSHVSGWPVHKQTKNLAVRIMLHGMSDRPMDDLVRLARSWLKPPECQMHDCGLQWIYDPAERAYVLSRDEKTRQLAGLELTIKGRRESPVVNPVLRVPNWGDESISLVLNGSKLKEGADFRVGHSPTLEGTDMAVWIKYEAERPVRIQLTRCAKR